MTGREAPPWLAAMQERFGAVIRTPLDRSSGTLRATTGAYDPAALAEAADGPRRAAAERLAIYNRQYWFRLFGVLQTAFPLTARLLGHWFFNEHSARFLLAHPPRHWDLDRAPDGFEDFLGESLGEDARRDLLLDAARLDAAWRRVFRAPAVAPFQPSASDAARLLDARLEASPATAIVVERWPLLALRSVAAAAKGEARVAAPDPLPEPRWWVLIREATGIRQLALEAREGELLALLRSYTVREALARVEAACPEAERAALPAGAQRWLAQGVARGLWTGISAPDQGVMQV